MKVARYITIDEVLAAARRHGVGINEPPPGHAFNWDDNDSLADALLDNNMVLTPTDLPKLVLARYLRVINAAERVADRFAKYQEKKKVDKANGRGQSTVYVYSDAAVSKRNNEKAERLQKFKPKLEKLRGEIKKELESEDPKTRLTALAIALIDETHERVGSPESADGDLNDKGESHYGVTQWLKSHITMDSAAATIRYTGKSGVKHEKKVTTPYILSALRDAHKAADGKESKLLAWEDGSVSASDVNAMLKPYEISAKDLRGLAANSLCQKALKKVRSKGGKLPEDKKEREKQLKAEFKGAIEEVAEELGHLPSTLSKQYLAPTMQSEYEKDGTVIDKLDG